MKQMPTIIFATDAGWEVARGDTLHDIPSAASANPAQVAEAISGVLGSAVDNATLAISTSWCLSATVSLTGVPARSRDASLLYRLEMLIPLSAEDIAADYIVNEPDTALAVCVSTARLNEFISAIEDAGVMIDAITPISVYAVQSLLLAQKSASLDAVLWQSGDSIDIFGVRDGIILSWYSLPATIDDLNWHLDQLYPDGSARQNIIACGFEPGLLKLLQSRGTLKLIWSDNRSIEQEVMSAARAGISSPVNLRRNGLAPGNALRAIRRPLLEAAAAALLLVACLCGASCWRAMRLEQLASDFHAQQQQIFREVFPGHVVPANIVSRLNSELRALGSGPVDPNAAPGQSALLTFQSALTGISSLAPETRLQVQELKVDDANLSIDGLVRNRADLSDVVDALQQTSRLQLDAPQTEQASGKGLHIILTGKLAGNSKSK